MRFYRKRFFVNLGAQPLDTILYITSKAVLTFPLRNKYAINNL